MSDFFDNIKKGDMSSIMGKPYPYKDNVKTNNQMGMNSKGSLRQLGRNVDGMIAYTGFLVNGKGASHSGDAGGNAYLLDTGAKCKHTDGSEAKRQIYVNNQVTLPPGGLIPGVIENSLKVAKGPMGLFGSFLGPNPQTCRTVTVKTRDINNKRGTESGILTDNDIKMISACSFSNNKNPVTGRNCSGFTLMYDVTEDDTDISKLPDDYIVRFFYGSVSLLALYLIYKVTNKK